MPRPRDPFRPVTHLGSTSVVHLGSRPVSRLGSTSVAHLGSRRVSRLGSRPVSRLGSTSVAHLGSRPVSRLGSRPVSRLGSRSAAPLGSRSVSRLGSEAGQASVELVALLPVLAVLLAGVWQAALAGHAFWAATTAAGAAARAHAVGADPTHAARSRLPGSLEHDLQVTTGQDGHVRVAVRIPALPGLPSPGRARADAHFEPQT